MTQVQHQPRIAWEGARAFVRAARSPGFFEFGWQVRELLGPEIYAQLDASREHLLASDIRTGGDRHAGDVEAGKWRWRLQDLLSTRPDLTGAVVELTGKGLEL
jgi:hypothetical protein